MNGATNRDEFERKLAKLYEDMYEGHGKENPAVVTRLSVLEEIVEKIDRNLNKMLWLVLGTFASGLVSLILRAFGK